MGFLDNGMPVDDLFADEIADNFEVGDSVFVTPRMDFLKERGVVTECKKFEGMFVQVETEMSGKRYYYVAKVSKIV